MQSKDPTNEYWSRVMKDQPMPEALLEVTHQKPLAEDFKPQKNVLLYQSYKRGTDAQKQEKYSLEESKVASITYLSDYGMNDIEEINFVLLLLENFDFFPIKKR